MANETSKAHWLKPWMIVAFAFAVGIAYCVPLGWLRPITFDFTGVVRDEDTGEPIEGAYVVATYDVFEVGIGASSRNCEKTKGMYTGKDGRFNFPIERLDNISPSDVTAIKPGYYGNKRELGDPQARRAFAPAAYANRDVYLKKQNPEKPEFRYGDFQQQCMHAAYRDDVEATITFFKIEIDELRRLNGPSQYLDANQRSLSRYEALPNKASRK